MLGIRNQLLITTFLSNRIANRIPAVMACTSSNAVDMIDVLPLPELSKLKIPKLIGMKENTLFVIQYYNNANNKTTD